jgi:hypothetical protein
VRTVEPGRKRDGGGLGGGPAEGGRSQLSTYLVAPTHAPLGTPTSNVVININGAAQYSPDLASPASTSGPSPFSGKPSPAFPPAFLPSRTLACGELTLLQFPGPSLTLRRVT